MRRRRHVRDRRLEVHDRVVGSREQRRDVREHAARAGQRIGGRDDRVGIRWRHLAARCAVIGIEKAPAQGHIAGEEEPRDARLDRIEHHRVELDARHLEGHEQHRDLHVRPVAGGGDREEAIAAQEPLEHERASAVRDGVERAITVGRRERHRRAGERCAVGREHEAAQRDRGRVEAIAELLLGGREPIGVIVAGVLASSQQESERDSAPVHLASAHPRP